MSRLNTLASLRAGVAWLITVSSLFGVGCATDVVLGEHVVVTNASTWPASEAASTVGPETAPDTDEQRTSEHFDTRHDDSDFFDQDRDRTHFFDAWDAGPPPRPPRPGDGFPPDDDGPMPLGSDPPFIFEPPESGAPPP